MEHITDGQVDRSRPTAITLGNFDGLHLGHRALIQLTKNLRQRKIWKVLYFPFLLIPCWYSRKKRTLL